MIHRSSTAFLLASLLALGCGGDDDDGMNGGPDAGGDPAPPSLGDPIDRTGRPAVSTATIQTFNGDSDAKGIRKDEYNAAGPSQWAGFKADIMTSLAIIDSLDETCGNQLIADGDADLRYGALADVLADDQLYVLSTSGECGVYLGLEGEIVGALEAGAGGCGGRTPADDVIDRSYSVLAAGILTGVDDTITANDKSFSDDFPFLAAPH
jgi:hypothetical protein